MLFQPADGLGSLYVDSAPFELFQGGIVPSYAIGVPEHFAPREAGARVGTALMLALFVMELGDSMSGKVVDLTDSNAAAFFKGITWNALNLSIVATLLWRGRELRLRPVG